MSPTSQEVQALFDRIAPVYDQLNTYLSLGQHLIWKGMTVQWSQAFAGATCLDLCCGSGDLARMLARTVGVTGQVFGLDFSAAQLAIARQRPPQDHAAAITWVQADALNLPYADQTFDAITMGYGLRNVTNISACLEEIQRVLKPGSKAAILDFHRPSQPWLQSFQAWYLQTIVVPLAAQFGLTDEYAYISPSLDRFPGSTEQVTLALQAGFDQAQYYELAGGMMGVLVAGKNDHQC